MSEKQFTDAEIIAALKATHGLVYLAAEKIGCTAPTIYNRVKESYSVSEALKTSRNRIKDVAEAKLYTALGEGEAWAVTFFLKTKGKKRGYVERSEVTGKDGKALEANVSAGLTLEQALAADQEANRKLEAWYDGKRRGAPEPESVPGPDRGSAAGGASTAPVDPPESGCGGTGPQTEPGANPPGSADVQP